MNSTCGFYALRLFRQIPLFLLISAMALTNALGQSTVASKANGDWLDPAIWNPESVPAATNIVDLRR